jgi:hypothetical protein
MLGRRIALFMFVLSLHRLVTRGDGGNADVDDGEGGRSHVMAESRWPATVAMRRG